MQKPDMLRGSTQKIEVLRLRSVADRVRLLRHPPPLKSAAPSPCEARAGRGVCSIDLSRSVEIPSRHGAKTWVTKWAKTWVTLPLLWTGRHRAWMVWPNDDPLRRKLCLLGLYGLATKCVVVLLERSRSLRLAEAVTHVFARSVTHVFARCRRGLGGGMKMRPDHPPS